MAESPETSHVVGGVDTHKDLHVAAGVEVLEVVTAPDKHERRRRGKNDDFDAESAAHAAFAERHTVTPRSPDGMVASLRVLRVRRKTAVQARHVALQMIQTLAGVRTSRHIGRLRLDPRTQAYVAKRIQIMLIA